MFWILEITVIGFLFDEEAIRFDGVYKEKFATEQACNDFKKSDEVLSEKPKLERIARRHMNDRHGEVTIKLECVVDGEPA